MSSRRALLTPMLAALVAAALVPSAAAARVAYFTGATEGGYAAPVELSTGALGAPVPIASEGPPPDVAITPDGRTAYVPSGFAQILPIDVATDTPGTPISTSPQSCPWAIAIDPAGARAYVTDVCGNDLLVVDLASASVVATVPVGVAPVAVAVTPDGKRALVSNSGDGTVTPVDLTTLTAGAPIAVGEQPGGIVVAPDGSRAYVTVRLADAVKRIDLPSDSVGPAIPVAEHPEQIALTPAGTRAFVLAENKPVTPIDLTTDTPGTPIEVGGHFLEGLAVTPDGSRAYVTDETANALVPIDAASGATAAAMPVGERPNAIAIVPDQPPHAAFSSSPSPALRGEGIAFDGRGSSDADGSVARYEWDFGDGSVGSGPTPRHSYAFAGTYTVTLTTTDNEGCSTRIVFPGQTAFCNGSPVARVSHQVQVNPKCMEAQASATTFVPKYRPARVAPGVRVRLAASAPAKLSVDATLSWRGGGGGTARLRHLDVTVQHWRRVRFVIPSKLRAKLPLGSRVSVTLRIEASPLDETLCPGRVVEKTLHVRVVKVIPGAVQRGRPR